MHSVENSISSSTPLDHTDLSLVLKSRFESLIWLIEVQNAEQ